MESLNKQKVLRAIPSVNEMLQHSKVEKLIDRFGKAVVTENLQLVMFEYRNHINMDVQLSNGTENISRKEITEFIVEGLENKLDRQIYSGLKNVINATGIVLHTNLGRAPLPEQAITAMKAASEGYCNLEFDLETGLRGSRHSHVEKIIADITGAQSAMIVNNNAAAVFLCLNTFAASKEIIISRGQQVEIGGSFRIPDIITRSGAVMVEVGTTNKTRLDDYVNSITDRTSVLLKVHTSNFKLTGFTQEVSLQELVSLGERENIIVMEDLGSGSLYDLRGIGLPYEPTVQESISSGASLVTFSGDKLLGGPQAGIIAGQKSLIDAIKKNPLARMVRCDKTTIAATIAVLSLYRDMDRVVEKIPALRMMALKEQQLEEYASELQAQLVSALGNNLEIEIIDDLDEVGGGSLPGVVLKGKAVALSNAKLSVNELQTQLRSAKIPIVCRINKDRILLNVRTIEIKDYPVIVQTLIGILV